MILLALLTACERQTATTTAARPTTAATSAASRSAATADFPAFQNGGALTGVATDDLPPPLELRWKYKVQDRAGFDGGPAIVGDSVYAADNKGVLHALALADGKLRWTYDGNEAFFGTPLVTRGLVIVGDGNGVVHAVDAATGKARWTFDAKATIHGAAVLHGESILIGNDAAELYSLTLEGKLNWTARAGERINSAPAVRDDLAYMAACDAQLRVLDLATGKEKSKADVQQYVPGSAVVSGDFVVVGTDQSRVVCLDARSLAEKWVYTQIEDATLVNATPAIGDGVVIVGARDNGVHAIDLATGARRWRFPTRGDVDAPAVIAAGRVYVGSRDARFYTLDLGTGRLLQEFPAAKGILAPAAVGRGTVVFGDSGGTVYCLAPPG